MGVAVEGGEGAGGDGDGAAHEAGQVLRCGLEVDGGGGRLDAGGAEEDGVGVVGGEVIVPFMESALGEVFVFVVAGGSGLAVGVRVVVGLQGDEGFEGEEVFGCVERKLPHLAVVFVAAFEEEIHLGEVLVEAVGLAADGEHAACVEVFGKGVDAEWEEAGEVGRVLLLFEDVGDALDGVEVFVITGQLGEAGEFETERTNLGDNGIYGRRLLLLAGFGYLPTPTGDGHVVGGVECVIEHLAQLDSFVEQDVVLAVGQIVCAEQASEIADSRFE